MESFSRGPAEAHSTYPRPQLRREQWTSLDGPWDFAIDANGVWDEPGEVVWNATIQVPFAPETKASGIFDTSFYKAVWYRRRFDKPRCDSGHRVMLHFGAVDYAAQVWVNGRKVSAHEGGYTRFSVDITDALTDAGAQEIVVLADDDPADLEKPRGKQDWKLEPHSIWYPRTTGIWQSVWLEVLPPTYLQSLRWMCNMERWEIGLEAHVAGCLPQGLKLRVRIRGNDQVIADDTYAFTSAPLHGSAGMECEVHRRIALSDPGIDDFRNDLLWNPNKPTLLDVDLELLDAAGLVLDKVSSYTALRSVAVQGDRFMLNGRPWPLRLVLDQGYWMDSGQTAPDNDAFVRDILLVKALGFNGVRKHQKIEDPRFLYWADHLGLLVWEEMPSAYRYTQRSVERLTREWIEVMKRDWSHPCIVTWVPFNESWGVPDLPTSPEQRHYVQALYHLTKTLDPTRPAIGNDGWESIATDMVGIHDYDHHPGRIARRYGKDEVEERLFKFERPGGRLLRLDENSKLRLPIVLTEFGGIALRSGNEASWGYSVCETEGELAERYCELLNVVRQLPSLAGFCYTQFTDTFQEANGLVRMDRTPKFSLDKAARATSGEAPEVSDSLASSWINRLIKLQQ